MGIKGPNIPSILTRATILGIVIILTLSLLPVLSSGASASPEAATGVQFHVATEQEVRGLMSAEGVWSSEVDYNVIVDGHGTGLAPPTLEEWEEIAPTILIVDDLDLEPGDAPSVDLSDDPCFPEIRSQGSQGSCAAWATTYYMFGYMQAKANGWADASTGNDAHLMSPAWTYNKVNHGSDSGSSMTYNAYILRDWGCASLGTMPYVASDHLSWGTEAAFREAPTYQATNSYHLGWSAASVDDIKALLADGKPVYFAIDANEYSDGFDGNYIITSSEYQSTSPNHAQTIVGYDDSITEDGEVGAFKVANSWGESWGDEGFYWLTYDLFDEIGASGKLYMRYLEIETTSVDLLAVWEFSTPPGKDTSMVISAGDSSTTSPFRDAGSTALPSFMCLDISSLTEELNSGEVAFTLALGSSSLSGTACSFWVEEYSSYPGSMSRASQPFSGGAPLPATVTSTFSSSTSPSAPTGLTATTGNGQIALSWNVPTDDGGSTITGYRIHQGTSSGDLDTTMDVEAVTEHTVEGLTNGVTYHFAISALNPVEGEISPSISATPATVPSAPLLTAVASDGEVELQWMAEDGGCPISSYEVFRGDPLQSILSTATTSYVDADVQNGVTYRYAVVAKNPIGPSAQSAVVEATPRAAPSAPRDLAAVPSDESVSLSWLAPLDDGGSAIIRYDVYRGEGGVPSFHATVTGTSFLDGLLENGMEYSYEVRAVNAIGTSNPSAIVTVTPMGVPGTPLSLTAVPGDRYASLTWSAPIDDGGGITGYEVYRGPGPDALILIVSTTQTSLLDQDLVNGVAYHYSVTAVNSVGTSAGAIAEVIPFGAPTAPLDLEAVPSDSTISLSWNAPEDDGGDAISGYNIYRGLVPGDLQLIACSSVLEYVDDGLENGVEYHYSVAAENGGGEGGASTVIAIPAGVPSPPSLQAFSGDGEVDLSWAVPDDGGSDITAYWVYRGLNSMSRTRVAIQQDTEFLDTSLTNGVTYHYWVKAINSVGQSTYSPEVTATPAGPPTSPLSPEADYSEGEVTLSWQAPVSDGGSVLIGYTVMKDSHPFAQIGPSTLSMVDPDIVLGSEYDYSIAAYNARGQSAFVTVSIGPVDLPSSPQDLAAVPGDSSISLSWEAPSSDGGSPLISYLLHVSAGNLVIDVTSTSYDLTGLENGVPCTVSVSAVNAVGEGEGASITATPRAGPTVPGIPSGVQVSRDGGSAVISWSAPDDGGSTILRYVVYRAVDGSALELVGEATSTSLTDEVEWGHSYAYCVSAVNSIGEGERSEAIVITASPDVAPPEAVRCAETGLGDLEVILGWEAPSYDGGAPIEGYRIYRSGQPIAELGPDTLSYVDDEVEDSCTYVYIIVAHNSAGEAEGSSLEVTAYALPGGCSMPVLECGDSSISIAWGPLSSHVLSYQLYRGTSTETLVLLSDVSRTEYTDTGLVNGVTYHYAVAAVNEAGVGQLSEIVTGTPVTVPGRPTALTAAVEGQNITLAWSPPLNDGGSMIIGYVVYMVTDEGYETVPDTDGEGQIHLSLPPGTYRYRVSAINIAGEGPMSEEVNVTVVSVDILPMVQFSVAWTSSSVIIEWDETQGADGYLILRGISPDDLSDLATRASQPFLDADVDLGVTYYYSVVALADGSSGAQGAALSITPVLSPAVPSDLTVEAADGAAFLSWSSSEANGGTVQYRIFRSVGEGTVIFLDLTDGTSYTDGSVREGVMYAYQLVAFNEAGDSGTSGPVSILIPVNVWELDVWEAYGEVSLFWEEPISGNVSSYRIYKGTAPGDLSPVATVTSTSFVDNEVEAGTTYHYRVVALNSMGEAMEETVTLAYTAEVSSSSDGWGGASVMLNSEYVELLLLLLLVIGVFGFRILWNGRPK